MTDGGSKERAGALVPGAHRVIRMLDAGEGPFAGALVTRGAGVAVQIDADALSGWTGWRFAGAEHVAAPLDLVRRVDGQDALLPWCPETVTAFLARRAVAGVALTAGETSTLVGSLLRGLDELAGGAEVTGGWWLTDDGRPVFATGEGEAARRGAAGIVSRLREESVDRALTRTLTAIQQGLEQERVPRSVHDAWETELFEIAAPRPLRREVFAAERARDLTAARAALDREDHGRDPSANLRRRVTDTASGTLERLAGLRESVSAAAQAVLRRAPGDPRGEGPGLFRAQAAAGSGTPAGERRRRRVRDRKSPTDGAGGDGTTSRSGGARRRRSLLVAGAAAAAVLTAGLLWPSGGSDEADAQTTPSDQEASAADRSSTHERAAPGPDGGPSAEEPSPRATEAADGTSSAGTDPVEAAIALLAMLATCGERGDAVCAEAVVGGAAGVVDALAGAAEAPVSLVDEYGDVAVVRLGPSQESDADEAAPRGELMIVLIRQNDRWLVRDAYGVADQPG